MYRILMAQCEQEISSFNPVPSEYDLFDVHSGPALVEVHRDAETCIRGALDVFESRSDVEVVPVYGAKACSAGPLSDRGFERIRTELLGEIERHAGDAHAMYFSLHGAMGTQSELDPEGDLLETARRILGNDVPIVISLDLHGILTERMLRHCDAITVYHTYPHEDFIDTGERAARLLLRILDSGIRPLMARVKVPALVRGPELITKTGLYGEIIRYAQRLEHERGALAAAMMIGNPFTDVPELCSQSLVVTDNDEDLARAGALDMAQEFWSNRTRMQAPLVDLERAIADARNREGCVTMTDAADAPSSGASGDSNAILRGLIEHGYPGRSLVPVVDEPAVASAHEAGIGAHLHLPIGGSLDPERFPPIDLDVEVVFLGDGQYEHQISRMPADAGRTAVLRSSDITLIAVSKPVQMMDRAIYLAHGCDPEAFDLIVVKSPGAYARFFTFAEQNYVVDVPGATTANLKLLGHEICSRPMFPMDEDAKFEPRVEVYGG